MSQTETYNEKLLLRQLSSGSEKAFLAIFNTYRKDIYAYSLSILKTEEYAEEVVQEVFLKIWLKRKELDLTLSFKSYLIVIAKNMALNFLKRAAYDKKMREEIFYQSQKAYNPIFNDIREKELDILQEKAIALLPPRRRLIFEMSRNEGKSFKEISAELGISINTVKSQMNKALDTIRTFLLENTDISLTLLIFALDWLG